jgi:hypothetical protein
MRYLKLVIVGLLLAIPGLAMAKAADIPGAATWYLHIDLEEMRTDEAGKAVYEWLREEAFDDVNEKAGVDFDKELDSITAYSTDGQGPVVLFEGNFSQDSKDKIMTFIALEGDLQAKKSSGKSYYRLTGNDSDDDGKTRINSGNLEIQLDSLEDESWVSTDIKNKMIITSSEEQMLAMLKSGGKIAGSRSHNGALVILTAETALLQAGMNSSAMADDDGDSGWDSKILRNTEQVAFLVAGAANQLAIEAKLITRDPDMANSLASVARGVIGLASFSDDMEADAIALLQGTKVEAKGNTLTISLAIDPGLLVTTLSD